MLIHYPHLIVVKHTNIKHFRNLKLVHKTLFIICSKYSFVTVLGYLCYFIYNLYTIEYQEKKANHQLNKCYINWSLHHYLSSKHFKVSSYTRTFLQSNLHFRQIILKPTERLSCTVSWSLADLILVLTRSNSFSSHFWHFNAQMI